MPLHADHLRVVRSSSATPLFKFLLSDNFIVRGLFPTGHQSFSYLYEHLAEIKFFFLNFLSSWEPACTEQVKWHLIRNVNTLEGQPQGLKRF